MSGWIRKLFGRAQEATDAQAPAQPFIVNLFDDCVVVHRPDGQREEVQWQHLASVVVRVSARAPWTGRAWLILPGDVGADGRQQGCVAPFDAMNFDTLLTRLQALPGFDRAALDQALDDARAGKTRADTVCWDRAQSIAAAEQPVEQPTMQHAAAPHAAAPAAHQPFDPAGAIRGTTDDRTAN
ncbi:hypothetical protein [Cupriavidus sp. AU9028]|uniref:hypothetical protein n=1 Tax=Cupriavidus sp. AU9028 TaxID=2871157 RepID=UPI001C9501A3|nr:hypothetical protein [Cupriavidus sp. AU9028]MBY4898911.1 hypothetical protein [Cupriavidus sp. AU9028]